MTTSRIARLEAEIVWLRMLLPELEDEVAAALVAWVGKESDKARSVSFRHVHGTWLVRIAEEHTHNEVEEPTLYKAWQQLCIERNPSPREEPDEEDDE